MANFTNNPLLKQVESKEGLKHKITRMIAAELKTLLETTDDRSFIRNRLRTIGVNKVGSDKQALTWWNDAVDHQMSATGEVPKISPARAKTPKKKSLFQRVGSSVLLF